MLTIIMFIILFLLCLWEQGALGNFQNKSVNSPFSCISRYVLFLSKLKGKRKDFFGRVKEGGPHCKIITWLI